MQMDLLTFDLIELDTKYRYFPHNACVILINMSSISPPTDTVPTFDALYGDRLGQLNDFQAV